MTTFAFLTAWWQIRMDAYRNRGEEGLTTAEWVVLVAAVVAMAAAAAAIIASKVSGKANGINL
jgi:hypothetical protein